MIQNIFEIKNLKCSYKPGKIVLEVRDLIIPFGKIVFIIGESGIGKSTILETLGLMNNTIVDDVDTVFKYCASPQSEIIDIAELWKYKKEKKIAEFRLNNFSFIFQQTNLMRNFTAYENIAITRMLQGKPRSECISKTVEALSDLDMGWVNFKRKVNELSGGQQQRLAFARAIVPDFSVLFGDEPTGNLDPGTADKVMTILKSQLKNEMGNHANSTAIIVSHSIELALKFGDVLIKINSVPKESDKTQFTGIIDASSVFTKDGEKWVNQDRTFSETVLHKMLM